VRRRRRAARLRSEQSSFFLHGDAPIGSARGRPLLWLGAAPILATMAVQSSVVRLAGFVCGASLAIAGCGAELANVSSRAIGCPASSITITHDSMNATSRTWTATCRGVPYECTSRGGGQTVLVTCGSHPSAERSASTSSPAHERVARETTAGRTILRTILSDGSFIVRVTASPATDPDSVDWIFRPRTDLPDAAACPVRMMVDEAPVDWTIERVDGIELHVRVPIAELRRIAAGVRVAARVCDREWRLSPTTAPNLAELLARLDEEHAWSGEQAPE
jgi:hypothetical protein